MTLALPTTHAPLGAQVFQSFKLVLWKESSVVDVDGGAENTKLSLGVSQPNLQGLSSLSLALGGSLLGGILSEWIAHVEGCSRMQVIIRGDYLG